MYEIFGVSVSGSKYYDLKKQTFSVPGDENCNLDDIKRYASMPTNGEFAKHYPGRIEAAREVYNAIMKEIGGKPMSTRKTLNTKHQTFAEYLTDLEGVYTSSRAKLAAATEKYRLERERYEKSQKDPALSEAARTIAKGRWFEAKEAYNQAMDELENYRSTEIKTIRENLQEHLDTFYAADPESIDANTMRLLESGILSGSEYARLVTANRENPTMLRIIGRYAKNKLDSLRKQGENASSSNEYSLLFLATERTRTFTTGEKEMSMFNALANTVSSFTAKHTANHPERMDEHWDKVYSTAKTELSAFPTQPAADE